MAATDIVRGYRIAVEETGRELETQSRIIAEQTARSVQAVDVVLRYISEQFKRGALSKLNEEDLHNYLKEQAIGLVQAEGLAMHNADGSPRAISWVYPAPDTTANVAALPAFQTARDNPKIDMLVGPAIQSRVDGQWFFPIGRRLQTSVRTVRWNHCGARAHRLLPGLLPRCSTGQSDESHLDASGRHLLARFPPWTRRWASTFHRSISCWLRELAADRQLCL